MAFEQNGLIFCSIQGKNHSKSYSLARIFNTEEGKKASYFAGMCLSNTPLRRTKFYSFVQLSALKICPRFMSARYLPAASSRSCCAILRLNAVVTLLASS